LSQNPPFRDRIPATMEYLRRFAVDSAYVVERGPMESMKVYKRRVYDTLHHISRMEMGPREIRSTTIWQNTAWPTVWKNLAETPVNGETKAAWYKVINDIIPTNERLHRIRIAPTDRCRHCDKKDTLQHRLTECGEGELIWTWKRQKLERILRTVPGGYRANGSCDLISQYGHRHGGERCNGYWQMSSPSGHNCNEN
jgi:hypothetical protein